MPLDFTDLEKYLSGDRSPAEVVSLLRDARYNLVQVFAEQSDSPELVSQYLDLLLLEEEFLKLGGYKKLCLPWK